MEHCDAHYMMRTLSHGEVIATQVRCAKVVGHDGDHYARRGRAFVVWPDAASTAMTPAAPSPAAREHPTRLDIAPLDRVKEARRQT